ncbi:MAG: CDP-2,3-bis-(O-geranylgeranyl)-sn-glycerol synthase [archaeon]
MTYPFLTEAILVLVPLYVANSTAMLLGGKTPIDLNKKFFDKKPFLGKGKTFKGTIIGILAGIVAVLLVDFYFQGKVPIISNYLLYGSLLSVGAILGDIIGSFFKRRFDIERGKPVLLLDQLDFVVIGILLGSAVHLISLQLFLLICFITLVAHKASNFIAFKFKLKKVPW